MTIQRRIVLALALIVSLLSGPAVAGPATASTGVPIVNQLAAPPSSCGSNLLCSYVNTGYRTDQGYELDPSHTSGYCLTTAFADSISSVWNNTGRVVRAYKNGSCAGSDTFDIQRGTGYNQLSVQKPSFENRINSYKFL